MENNFAISKSGRELGAECKRATSRLHFSLIVYLLVVSVVVSFASFGLSIFNVINPALHETIMGNPFYASIILWTLQILSMYVISFPVFHSMTKHLEKRDLSGGEKLGFIQFIMVAILCMGLMLIGSIVAGTVSDALNEFLGIAVEDSTSELIGSTDLWIVILVVVIIGPIFEELIFRKIFIDAIGKYSIGLAVFISASSFALFHGNITQAIYTFAAGLVLAWVYAKTKKMIYPILLHMFINFFGSVPSLLVSESYDRILSMTEEELMATTDPQILSDLMKVNAVAYMQIGFMVVGALILIYMLCTGAFKLDKSGETKIPFFKKLGILIFNWGTFAFVAYSIISIVLELLLPLIEPWLENYFGTV